MARKLAIKQPKSPMTTQQLLDYAEQLQGEQVDVFKLLARGIARSSYSIHYYPDSQTFDVFANICDAWEEVTREQFLEFHGDGAPFWHLL